MNGSFDLTQDTLKVLLWAEKVSREDETVAMFWKALCNRFDFNGKPSARRIFEAVREAGSNSIADIFRDCFVPYPEVAWDVAEKLRPFLDDAEYKEQDILACEGYVLSRMEIDERDVRRLCDVVRSRGTDEAVKDGYEKAGRNTILETTAYAIARMAAKKAAEKAMAEASKRVAQKVATEVAKQVFARVLLALNVVLVMVTVVDLAGPAYRKTIPAVTFIAILRKLHAAAGGGRKTEEDCCKERKRPEDTIDGEDSNLVLEHDSLLFQ